jgi:hypothetical protein
VLNHLETPRCPECGRAFDPADPLTFVSRGIPEWVTKRLAQKTVHTDRWRALAIAMLIPVMFLTPGMRFFISVAGSLTLVMFFYFGASQLVNGELAIAYRLKYIPERRRWWLWGMMLVAWLLALAGQPGFVLIHIERPALEAFCHHIYAEEPCGTHERGTTFVGLIVVRYDVTAGGVELRCGPRARVDYTESIDGASRSFSIDFNRFQVDDEPFPRRVYP